MVVTPPQVVETAKSCQTTELYWGELTDAADPEAAGAGAGFGAALLVAVLGGEAGPVVAGHGDARIVLERDDCEERQNWN